MLCSCRSYIELPASIAAKYDVIIDDGRARVPAGESVLRSAIIFFKIIIINVSESNIKYANLFGSIV
jgi:hypothetical protein